MYHSAGGLREGGTRPSPVEGNVCGVWGPEQKAELEHTDVESLTDVSGTDASFAQQCAAAWTCTRVFLAFAYSNSVCLQYIRKCVQRYYNVKVLYLYVSSSTQQSGERHFPMRD